MDVLIEIITAGMTIVSQMTGLANNFVNFLVLQAFFSMIIVFFIAFIGFMKNASGHTIFVICRFVLLASVLTMAFAVLSTPFGPWLFVVELISAILIFLATLGYGYNSAQISGESHLTDQVSGKSFHSTYNAKQTRFSQNPNLDVLKNVQIGHDRKALNFERESRNLPPLDETEHKQLRGNLFD